MNINILFQALIIVSLILPILTGFLMGPVRGFRRSLIRLILVALSIVLAFVLRATIAEKLAGFEIDGQPLSAIIAQELFQGQNVPAELVTNIVSLLSVAIAFVASLILLLFVTWAIIFPFCKLFLKKRNHSSDSSDGKRKKRKKQHNGLSRLLGGILGLAQGVAVAVALVTVLNGLFFNTSNIFTAVNNMNGANEASVVASAQEGETSDGVSGGEDYEEFFNSVMKYNDSGIRKFIGKMGGDRLFDEIVCIKTEEDKITLTGQIDAFRGAIEMMKELSSLQNVDMSGGLSADAAEQLSAIFGRLDEINSGLSDESKKAINTLVKALAEDLLPDVDFREISFANEGQVITDLSAYKQTDFTSLSSEEAIQKATDIVNSVANTDVVLPLLSSNSDFTIGLQGEAHEYVKSVIAEMEQDAEANHNKVDMLKRFFSVTA